MNLDIRMKGCRNKDNNRKKTMTIKSVTATQLSATAVQSSSQR